MLEKIIWGCCGEFDVVLLFGGEQTHDEAKSSLKAKVLKSQVGDDTDDRPLFPHSREAQWDCCLRRSECDNYNYCERRRKSAREKRPERQRVTGTEDFANVDV
jgi:hypothetical protein